MYLFFPFLTVTTLLNQKKVAINLCKGYGSELADFQNEYLKNIIGVVAHLDTHFSTTPDYNKSPIAWLSTSKGSYFWDEESGDIYAWVILRIKTLSCRYKGEAPLVNYLFSSLFKEWTKIDYIRYETKVTGYVPPYIQDLGEDYEKVYLALVRFKPGTGEDHLIASILKMDNILYTKFREDIESKLREKGKIYRIQKEDKPLSLDQIVDEDDENTKVRKPFSSEPAPDLLTEYQDYSKYMKKSYSSLDTTEQWFVKSMLVKNRNALEIFSLLQKDKVLKKYKSDLNIKSQKSVYSALERILHKVEKQIITLIDKKEFPKTISQNLIKRWLQNTLLYDETL